MTEPCEDDNCDKQCGDHKSTVMLLEQHSERIGAVENMAVDVSVDISNLEGRVNTFIWIIGGAFFLLCSMAFYGVVQIDRFKDMYLDTTVAIHKVITEIKSAVEVTSNSVDDLSEEIEEIKENQ